MSLSPRQEQVKACDVSVVVPCLNEAPTLGHVIQEIRVAMLRCPAINYEVVIADNGSTDASPGVAHERGARVVNVPRRGYGSALKAGICAASGSIVVMLDADSTYDASFVPDLINRLHETNADLVIGTRLKGSIDRGAMPPLHRYLGTPLLTMFLRQLYAAPISDCNSGMRAFKRDAFIKWNVCEPGMEFASEMIMSAARSGAVIKEVPIHFRRDPRVRQPHLRRWSDGMRHLLLILSRAPDAFMKFGIGLLMASTLMALAAVVGPIRLGSIEVLSYHTILIAVLLGVIASQCIGVATILSMQETSIRNKISEVLLSIEEGRLFWLTATSVGLSLSLVLFLVARWALSRFGELGYLTLSLETIFVVTVFGSLSFQLLCVHVLKRAVHLIANQKGGHSLANDEMA